jgi:hypothetical protein
MERARDGKQSVLANLIEHYQLAYQHLSFKVFPQMPAEQIQYFVKQAARDEQPVTIQLHEFVNTHNISEVSGTITLSPHSSHIILKPADEHTIHLIQPNSIRHVRLSKMN